MWPTSCITVSLITPCDERLGLRAFGNDVAARLEQVQHEVHLVRRPRLHSRIAPAADRAIQRRAALAAHRHCAVHLLGHEAPRTAGEHVAHRDVGIEDFAGARVRVMRPAARAALGRDIPADRGVARIHVIPVGVVRLLPHDQASLKADAARTPCSTRARRPPPHAITEPECCGRASRRWAAPARTCAACGSFFSSRQRLM